MKEEENILRMAGRKAPFRVPDGYFEGLTERVMDGLPEVERVKPVVRRVSMWDRVKPWIYMAAMFMGAALIIRVATYNPTSTSDAVASTEADEWEMSYLDNVLAQQQIDSYSLYVYLSDADEY